MGFDLRPIRLGVENFSCNTSGWDVVLEACGYIFPIVTRRGTWFHAPDIDPLVNGTDGYGYRLLVSNDELVVSADDAKLMARCARNFAALNGADRRREAQPDPGREQDAAFLARFAVWADRSGGFEVG